MRSPRYERRKTISCFIETYIPDMHPTSKGGHIDGRWVNADHIVEINITTMREVQADHTWAKCIAANLYATDVNRHEYVIAEVHCNKADIVMSLVLDWLLRETEEAGKISRVDILKAIDRYRSSLLGIEYDAIRRRNQCDIRGQSTAIS